jgi:hypothetical protein
MLYPFDKRYGTCKFVWYSVVHTPVRQKSKKISEVTLCEITVEFRACEIAPFHLFTLDHYRFGRLWGSLRIYHLPSKHSNFIKWWLLFTVIC